MCLVQAQAGANISVLVAVVHGVTTAPISPFGELGTVSSLVFVKHGSRDCIGKTTPVLKMWKAAFEPYLYFDISPAFGMIGNGLVNGS
jgi:hypothetical protein